MNLYEAIYARRSVRNYRMEPLDDTILKGIPDFLNEVEPLFPDIRTEIRIVNRCTEKEKIGGFCNVKAPYYVALYSESKEKSDMNAGFLMEQLSLYLETRGIGSGWLEERHPQKASSQEEIMVEAEGLSLKIVLAFGFPKETDRNRDREPKRIAMDDLCVYKEQPKAWVKEMLEAARLAPSSTNSQPWRFVVYENRIHVFSKKPLDEKSLLNPFTELNFGIMLANVMVAAEEVWVDLDLIKLNNITHKSIPNNQYVISILLKP